MVPSDEHDLCAQAQAGSRVALGELLKRHGSRLYRSVLLPRLGNRDAAEEALGITYTKVVEHIGQFVWQDVGIYPWLRTIALRVAIDILRQRRRELLFSPQDIEHEIDHPPAQSQTPEEWEELDLATARQRVTDLLEQLHPRYAEVIRYRVLDGQSREQTAALLGISTSTCDVVIHRAMVALRKLVASHNGSET